MGETINDSQYLNDSIGGTADGGVSITIPAAYGVSDGMQTHKATLELAGRIGRTSWKLLINSRSTGNYIST